MPEIRRFLCSLLGRLVTPSNRRPPPSSKSKTHTPPPMTSTTLLKRTSAPAASPPPPLSPSPRPVIPPTLLPPFHTILNSFHGISLRWTSRAVNTSSSSPRNSSSDHCSLELSFHNRHRDAVYSQYIPHVSRIHLMGRDRRLYINCPGSHDNDHHRLWSSAPFAHPATFDTLAIDPALRDDLHSDLFCFVDRHDRYTYIGRAWNWKREYLLHGPPRMGKTNLVAAIANLLKFDIYNQELTAVSSNT